MLISTRQINFQFEMQKNYFVSENQKNNEKKLMENDSHSSLSCNFE